MAIHGPFPVDDPPIGPREWPSIRRGNVLPMGEGLTTMVKGDSGRDLLYGVLALQTDFVGREALMTAVRDWSRDGSRSLGEVLVDAGAIDEESRAILETMVSKHVAIHGGDAEKSLASVAVTGQVHEELETIAGPEFRASIANLSTVAPSGHDPYATHVGTVGGADDAHRTYSSARFQILRPHARGGLGEVHLAHDLELGREVALKQIQDRHADHPESRSRFLLEAEVTGRLEHPGIVPVYGLGRYQDGRPYYAMRFIRGESLKDAIRRFHRAEGGGAERDRNERDLESRQLLRRFVDACHAIAYAHSRGVIHRDI
jgi:eukaryotic-like serine/threonine-protein kinase